MRVLFWYCDHLAWRPTLKTLEEAPPGDPASWRKAVAAFVHVEPEDEDRAGKVETKLVKNAKWLAAKWDTRKIVLHSFTHLGEEKAPPAFARQLLEQARDRLLQAGYEAGMTPWGHFNDLTIEAPGHPLARIFKQL